MPASKIVDEAEVLRWFADGKTYSEMSAIYRDKYNVEMSPTAWGNFRKRRGLVKRIAWDEGLIPWKVKTEHRLAYPIALLRLEARARAGYPLSEDSVSRLRSWRERLERDAKVVDYSPEQGFVYVDRRPEDDDIIRKPLAGAPARRRAAEDGD